MMQRLKDVDRRILYLIFFLVTAIPYIWPMSVPMQIAEYTKDSHQAIDSLKAGDFVLVDIRFGPSAAGEMVSGYRSMINHVLRKPGVRIVWFCTSQDGIIYAEEGIKMAEAAGRVYGKDIAQMGYVAGEETAIAAACQDIFKAFPSDSRGAKSETLEVLKGIRTAKDFTLVLHMCSGGLGPLGWVRQANMPFGTKIVGFLSTIQIPSAIPYYQAKQVAGLISGLLGGAQYEQLLGAPGRAMASMGSQTYGHAYIVLLTILANAGYLSTKAATKAAKGGRAQ